MSQNPDPPSNSSSLLSLPLPSKKDIIRNLDVTIAKFSDGNLFLNNEGEKDTTIDGDDLKRFAPLGLEEQFRQLYSIINSSLHRSSKSTMPSSSFLDPISSSAAAILLGKRGSGKSLLLERVLLACRRQQRYSSDALYRVVTINGIVCRGQDVSSVVYEIIRQLSEIAYHNYDDDDSDKDDNNEKNEKEIEEVRANRKRQKTDKSMLRLRKSTFTSNLALLDSTLEIADTDGIPILLILDELDFFTEEGERQMLLYYFLDRVTTPGSNLILVGVTSSFSALTLLEKRIRSRAEGAAKIIYMHPPPTYQGLVEVMKHKLKDCVVSKDIIQQISLHPVSKHNSLNTKNKYKNDTTEEITKVSIILEREFRLGKDFRWFSRLIAASLSLYRHNCLMVMPNNWNAKGIVQNFHTKFIQNAMVMMGASMSDNVTGSRQPDLCIVNGTAVSCRLQAMLDLSTPQVALILSARRILARERHREQVVAAPLTMERIVKEYDSYRRGSTSTTGDFKLLKQAAYHLMEQGLLVPSMDHSGGGPMQYYVTKIYRNLDSYRMFRLPMQIPLDIERELGKALESNLLECPAALKEWGKAIK